MLSDSGQKIILGVLNEVIDDEFKTEADLAEYLIEQNRPHVSAVSLWTVDEGHVRDISEDIAEAWIKSMEDSVNAVILEEQCPDFVRWSMAWDNYKEEQGV